MVQGLPPLDANIVDLQTDIPEDEEDWEAELPPDFILIGALGTKPKSLNDVLSGTHAKEWQTTLDYEIGQLEKLGTWVIEDLPKRPQCDTMQHHAQRKTCSGWQNHLLLSVHCCRRTQTGRRSKLL